MHQIDILVHVGASIILIGYGVRDQIVLRIMVILGTLFYVAFYLSMDTPLWSSLLWNALFISINIFMIIKLYRDRIVGKMSYNEQTMFRFLHNLNPGEFRKIRNAGIIKTTDSRSRVCDKRKKNNRLYLILDGAAEVLLPNKNVVLGAGAFIGEISFLNREKSSADVFLLPNTTYVVWEYDHLEELFRKNNHIKNCLNYLIAQDVTRKLSSQ